MKKKPLLLAIILCLLLLSSCGTSGTTPPAGDGLTPTGLDGGKPQLAMIFHDGSLYENDTSFFLEEKDGGMIEVPGADKTDTYSLSHTLTFCGNISSSSDGIPDTELAAYGVDAGTKVYTDESGNLFTENDGILRAFVKK